MTGFVRVRQRCLRARSRRLILLGLRRRSRSSPCMPLGPLVLMGLAAREPNGIVPALSAAAQECGLEGGGLLDSPVGYKGTDIHRDWGGALALWI